MNRHTGLALRCAAACMVALLGATSTTSAQTTEPTKTGTSVPSDSGSGSEPAPTAEPPQQKPEQPPASQDGFRMGDFTFKPGGRIKVDIIRDFKPIGSEDSFDPRTIPVDGSEGTNSNVHAKETRLNLEVRGMVQDRDLRMFVETDFYGSNSVLRLRHAYGVFGGLLAGQTWSTFMDDDNLPRTIDFEAPMAFAQIRQAQVRWTQKLAPTVTWSAALEDNKSAITIPDLPGKAEYPMPDLVTRFRFDIGPSHVTTSAFIGAARFRPTDGDTDTVTLWGTMLSAKFMTSGRDYVYGVVTVGEGIGRYRGGVTAVPDENNKLHAAAGTAVMLGYEHFWNEKWSTNAVYSNADTNDEPFYGNTVNKRLNYGAVNLLYWFLGDRGWTGVEYIYGRREVFGGGSDDGTAHRVQYAVRFNLP